jgi:hypothetical protein
VPAPHKWCNIFLLIENLKNHIMESGIVIIQYATLSCFIFICRKYHAYNKLGSPIYFVCPNLEATW